MLITSPASAPAARQGTPVTGAPAEALRAIPVVHTCHVNGDACDACNDARHAKALRDDAAALSGETAPA